MKKIRVFLIILLICLFTAACGNSESTKTSSSGTKEYMDVVTDTEKTFQVTGEEQRLGIQFYQGEPIQLLAQMAILDGKENVTQLCIQKADGSKEILVQNTLWVGNFGYVGVDQTCYLWDSAEFKKISQTGEIIYSLSLRDLNIKIQDICQLNNGELYLLIVDNTAEKNANKLSQMDAETGEMKQITKISQNDLSSIAKGGVAAGEDGLLIMTSEGVRTLDTEDGSKVSELSFVGSSYILENSTKVYDFRVAEENCVEILWGDGSVETLEKKDVSVALIPITMRGIQFTKNTFGNWLKARVAQFNQENGRYYVVLEECDPQADPADFARTTSVEISTGKGPDILYGSILEDYIDGMIEKGAFEDLSSYMKNSGMNKEDYFPCAFNCWQVEDKIYGINFMVKLINYHIDEAVLGEREIPDIEKLVNALLAWQEKAVYMEGYDSTAVLRQLLEGSDSMWGTVNWNEETCDFDSELFIKMLEVAKRFGDDDTNGYEALADRRLCEGFYIYESKASQIETGKVTSGVLFDDGCYGAVLTNWILAVNTNSENKEGAWEFISYLLSEESQVQLEQNALPVHRGAFQILADVAPDPSIKMYRNGAEVQKANASEVAEMVEIIENARPLPIRTVPILDIICEEASDYFEGSKSAEEVITVIENRVRLYLEE